MLELSLRGSELSRKVPFNRVVFGIGLFAACCVDVIVVHRHNQPIAHMAVAANRPGSFVEHIRHVPTLKIEQIVQHGHIIEIKAHVEPGVSVMINGQRAIVWGQEEIKHSVGPLPDGVSDIAITVQNDEGDINSKQLSIVMP
jgi:hypothetical protein